MLCACAALTACSVKDLVTVPPPSGILDPDELKNYDGAISITNGAVSLFNIAYMGAYTFNGSSVVGAGPFATASGVMGDEFFEWSPDFMEGRQSDFNNPGNGGSAYTFLGNAHMNAGLAIRYLHTYAPEAPTAYLAKAFIVRSYVDIFLSELYCSGVPLADATADGTIAYTAGVPKDSLWALALAQLDSAAAYAPSDSTSFLNLIQLARARVYLNQDKYDQAAQAVAGVPTSFAYKIQYASSPQAAQNWFRNQTYVSVADSKGGNGLNYRSANDPRVQVDYVTTFNNGGSSYDIYVPRNLRGTTASVALESGVGARLIEAEVFLSHQQYGDWLKTLNDLRIKCTAPGSCTAGDGGVAGLDSLQDPGNDHDRLMLTFREKAFWLFATGHRQGDMRRLIRQYNLPPNTVYPTGAWREGLQYGSFVNSVPDPLEIKNNPQYTGCVDREA
jgi:hypothetical protein